ncbi:hypothetical protein BJY52DRAFT_1229080 [Lactarius psammicola]|nr:hypothetical protein BJY52DRAFT_1229080 [Lactarius psammicola]
MFCTDDHVGIARCPMCICLGHTGKSADTKTVPLSIPNSYYTMQQLNAPASLWGLRWCSTGSSPSTASYPPSPTLHRVPLLPHPLFPPFPYRIRGPDEYVGIRLASEYLAVSVDACNQRVLRPTLRSTLSPLPTANSIDIVDPGGIHEDAGTTVDFWTLEGSLIEVYLHTMQSKEALGPTPSASAPQYLLQRQHLLPPRATGSAESPQVSE